MLLQSDLLVSFLYPLLFVFVLIFAILEKTELFGKGKTQLNAILSLVIGLIFVGFVVPKMMVNNLLQFMSVGLFVIFVGLMLWGFVSGNKDLTVSADGGKKIHKLFVILIFGSIVFAVLWIVGWGEEIVTFFSNLFALFFNSDWSNTFWTNFVVIVLILIIIFVITGFNPFGKKIDLWLNLK